ncbi:CxxC-x17-CxxC domain-containing protein [Patescibacteria group bacterium]
MGNYNYSGGSRGGRGGGGRSYGGGRDGGRPQMHDAVCDECGNDCQVPFRPSGDKPIYCSNCFDRKGGRDSGRSRGGRRDGGRPSHGGGGDRGLSQLAESMEKVNNKLDTIIGLLSPAGEKKVKPAKKEKKKAKKK